ncbi:hypothetical protein GCM10011507_25920 [Edaphobacter acidisoli]|uniref:VOC domain-containing protein n=1 Tax=Edaphobacter acidisoli TaxID=2040573 RepID=A0A916W7P8_9BACT|nr:VOC family protein [Edaphobacter acidisoli]GGA73112.1 hypothetical protein GCM10011507_25920 [Edaphobacter acidisoli]
MALIRRVLVSLVAGIFFVGAGAAADPLPLLGLARVTIRVSDLSQARTFYSGVAGFQDAYDVRSADGSIAAAYFKINDQQFLEVVPGLKPTQPRPMVGFAIRTDQLQKLHQMLKARGLHPGKIHLDQDGSRGFMLTDLPGQNLDYLEFVDYGPKSLAERTKGQNQDDHRLSTNLEHVGIIATDFDAAYNFYVKTLGFHEVWRRVAEDGKHVIIDHIQMPGPSGDFVELSNFGQSNKPLERKRAAGAAHLALTVADINATVEAVHARQSEMKLHSPRYGLDNRWNFNLFDPDSTRVEFMQVADPAHPAPAVVTTPANFQRAGGALGLFTEQSDIGDPALPGSASFDSAQNQYVVSGAGANIWGKKDEFHFVWRSISGDFSLTATVHFPKQEPPSHRKAALMARQSLDDDAPYADAVVHGSGLTELQFRETKGDATHAIRFPVDAPVQIRLERKDGWFTMYAGREGQPLQELGAYALKLNEPFYLGLGVCSHNAATLETAIFSNVSVEVFPKKQRKGKPAKRDEVKGEN